MTTDNIIPPLVGDKTSARAPVSRRDLLKQGSAVAAVAVVGTAAMVAIAKAAPAEPLLDLWRQYLALNTEVDDLLERCAVIEAQMKADGLLTAPRVQNGWIRYPEGREPFWEYSEAEIEEHACAFGPDDRPRRLAKFREVKAQVEADCERYGLVALERQHDEVTWRLGAIEDAIRATPAVTMAGVAVRLRYTADLVPHSNKLLTGELAAVIADLDRLMAVA